MISRSSRGMVFKPITCCSVMRWASTPRGMKCPQHKKTEGAFRPLERGFEYHTLRWLVRLGLARVGQPGASACQCLLQRALTPLPHGPSLHIPKDRKNKWHFCTAATGASPQSLLAPPPSGHAALRRWR